MSSRGTIAVIAALGLVLAVAPASRAQQAQTWQPGRGGWTSGLVEYVDTVPIDAGGAVSGRLHGGYLYLSGWRSFSIYDVSNPIRPALVAHRALAGQLFNEQPDTDGKTLIMAKDFPSSALEIWDVRDKANPTQISSFPLPKPDHMWTCVLDCSYAYGGRGTIVDLRDPAAPKIVGDWTRVVLPGGYHAIEEVAPGIVITGTVPTFLLDARKDPANPKRLAAVTPTQTSPSRNYVIVGNPRSLPALTTWPLQMKSRYLLMAQETPFSGRCDDKSGGFRTYDTRDWEKTETFTFVDEYQISENGTYTDGRPPYNVIGCGAYAFDTPPNYAKSGMVAAGWFEHGVRMLHVDKAGKITETGGFIPHGGNTSTTLYVTDAIVYSIDLNRGLDILRAPSL